MILLRNSVCFLFLALLTACQTVSTKVESYSVIPSSSNAKTVYIKPGRQAGSAISWRAAQDDIAKAFKQKGLEPVPSRKGADLIATISMAIDDGRVVNSFDTLPNYGVTGVYVSPGYSSNTFSVTPTYGTTGYTVVPVQEVKYAREMYVVIADGRSRKTLFEAEAFSFGTCGSLSAIAPLMLKSILKDYPKASNGRVQLPLTETC